MSAYPPGSSPHRLPEGHEARDLLTDILMKDGLCIAVFKFGAVAFPEELEPRLSGLIGQTVAVLRMDGRYHCREL